MKVPERERERREDNNRVKASSNPQLYPDLFRDKQMMNGNILW